MAAGRSGGKSRDKITLRLQRVAELYRRGVVPTIIAAEVGVSTATLKTYIKQLAARGEITLPEKAPRRADDPVTQLLARAKKRGTPAEERQQLLEEFKARLDERHEASNAIKEQWAKDGGHPVMLSTLGVALEALARQVAAKQDQEQRQSDD